jgi:hypothetical protein
VGFQLWFVISLVRLLRSRLGQDNSKGGISPAAPPELAPWLQSLPPMLHILSPGPMPSCSKAPRGLSVLVRVAGIFTGIAISPSPSLRQCPDRYAIRAGRNLPDKEFRYLRTVIVTAAVYRGFISQLAPLHLTFRHWAGVSPYTSTFVLAQTCVFAKQSPGRFRCGLRPPLCPNHVFYSSLIGTRRRPEADLIPKLRSLYCRVP